MIPNERNSHQLHAADARILDWLVEHGFDASKVKELPAEDHERALAVLRQINVLDAYTVEQPHDSLVDATVARIDRYEADRAAALQIANNGRVRRRVRLADIIGIAAMIMLSAAVLLPIASQVRAKSLATVCAANMRELGGGLASYANANHGQLVMAGLGGSMFGTSLASSETTNRRVAPPMPPQAPTRAVITPSRDGKSITITPDWGTYRHSSNLAKLVTDGYCEAHALNCPGCEKCVACFAYRVPATNSDFQLNTPKRMVLVADANPVLELRLDGHRLETSLISSRNHGDRGQNMLFSDGAVEWHLSPVLPSANIPLQQATQFDNIWLPRDNDGREKADLKYQSTDPNDNFVAQ